MLIDAAACGPFSVCYSFREHRLVRRAAAACGPFSVCYSSLASLWLTITAAACGPFSVCYSLGSPHRGWSLRCGLRSFLGLLQSSPRLRSFLSKLRLAVLSRFATVQRAVYQVVKRAAACGPFSVCYSVINDDLSRPAAAACGPFSVCYSMSG